MTGEPLADARDMFAVHTMFRREFGAAPNLISSVADGDEQRTATVADHIALMNLILQVHHSAEDNYIWPLLRERGGAEIASIIRIMEQQHAGIHEGYVRVEEALADWRESASAASRDALAATIGELLPLLDDHLSLEETRVVPQIERYLTKSEYARMAEDGSANTPEDVLPLSFGMIMYEADTEVIDNIVAEMPDKVQPFIRDVAAVAYADYAQKLYGTAAPARVCRTAQFSEEGQTK